MKYAYNLVLLAKEETVLHGMIDKITKIGRCYGMEMNVDKTKVMRISRERSPLQVMTDQKQLKNLEYFNYFGSIITNHARCEIKSRNAMAKAAFNRKKVLFTRKLDLNLRKKLVKYYIFNIAGYCAETWTLHKVDHKYLESFEMWC